MKSDTNNTDIKVTGLGWKLWQTTQRQCQPTDEPCESSKAHCWLWSIVEELLFSKCVCCLLHNFKDSPLFFIFVFQEHYDYNDLEPISGVAIIKLEQKGDFREKDNDLTFPNQVGCSSNVMFYVLLTEIFFFIWNLKMKTS